MAITPQPASIIHRGLRSPAATRCTWPTRRIKDCGGSNLRTRTVTTVAGHGRAVLLQADSGPALESRLNSPWDVRYIDGRV